MKILSVIFLLFFATNSFGQCNNIDSTIDRFSDKKSYYSPTIEGISFMKVKRDSIKTDYYLYMKVLGLTAVVDGKGFAILFENKTKIIDDNKNVDIEVEKHGNGYIYSVFYRLDEKNLKLLSENKIIAVKNYIFERDITDGDAIRNSVNCIIAR